MSHDWLRMHAPSNAEKFYLKENPCHRLLPLLGNARLNGQRTLRRVIPLRRLASILRIPATCNQH